MMTLTFYQDCKRIEELPGFFEITELEYAFNVRNLILDTHPKRYLIPLGLHLI